MAIGGDDTGALREEIVIDIATEAANRALKEFRRTYDQAMDSAVESSAKATEASEELGGAHENLHHGARLLHKTMFELGSVFGRTNTEAGHVLSTFAEIGVMASTGGLLGAGVAAGSAALVGMQAIWEKLTESSRLAEEQLKRNAESFRAQLDDIQKYREATATMGQEADLALLSGAVGPGGAKEITSAGKIRQQRDQLAELNGEFDALAEKERTNAKGLTNEEQLRMEVVRQSASAASQRLMVLEKELQVAHALAAAERDRANELSPRGPQLRAPTFGGRDVVDGDQYRLKRPGMLTAGDKFDAEAQAEREAGERRGLVIRSLEERIAAGKLEIRQHNAERIGELEEKANEESLRRTMKWADAVAGVTEGLTNAALDALEARVAGEKVAWGQIAANTIKGLGRQIMGMGVKDLAEGVGRGLSSYGFDATAYSLIEHGGAELAIGGLMAATGAVMSGSIKAKSNAAASGGGGSGFGAGGSTGFDRGQQKKTDTRPVIIQINGAFTTHEQSVMVQQGLDAARRQGLLS